MKIAEDIYTAQRIYSLTECQEFIALSEEIGYQAAPISIFGAEVQRPDVRNNARVILDDEELAEKIWRRVLPHVPIFRTDKRESLRASRIVDCSHLIAYWVELQPLGKLLGKAIDGGDVLDVSLWHPFRPPVFHATEAVREIYTELQKEWDAVKQEFPVSEGDWYGVQIKEIVELFGWAQERKEAIVSIMSLPFDAERTTLIIEPNLS